MPDPSLDLLRGVPLFAKADDRFLGRLAGEFMERTYAPDELIAEEGESGKTFIVIEAGEVAVIVHGRRSAGSAPATPSARWR